MSFENLFYSFNSFQLGRGTCHCVSFNLLGTEHCVAVYCCFRIQNEVNSARTMRPSWHFSITCLLWVPILYQRSPVAIASIIWGAVHFYSLHPFWRGTISLDTQLLVWLTAEHGGLERKTQGCLLNTKKACQTPWSIHCRFVAALH